MSRACTSYDCIRAGTVNANESVSTSILSADVMLFTATVRGELGIITTQDAGNQLAILFGCLTETGIHTSLVIHCGAESGDCAITVPEFANGDLNPSASGVVTYDSEGNFCPATFSQLAVLLEITPEQLCDLIVSDCIDDICEAIAGSDECIAMIAAALPTPTPITPDEICQGLITAINESPFTCGVEIAEALCPYIAVVCDFVTTTEVTTIVNDAIIDALTPGAITTLLQCQDLILDDLTVATAIGMGPCPLTTFSGMSNKSKKKVGVSGLSIETDDFPTQVGDVPNVATFQTATSTSGADSLWIMTPLADFAYKVLINVVGVSTVNSRFGGHAEYYVIYVAGFPVFTLIQEQYLATGIFAGLGIVPQVVGFTIEFNPPVGSVPVSYSTRINVERTSILI